MLAPHLGTTIRGRPSCSREKHGGGAKNQSRVLANLDCNSFQGNTQLSAREHHYDSVNETKTLDDLEKPLSRRASSNSARQLGVSKLL